MLQHLADSDLVWGWRVRLILAHDRPTITGYDQDLWAERLRYELADPAESLATFDALRRANLRLLEGATAADLARVGVHAERGEESVVHLVRLYAGHDLLHLRPDGARVRGVVLRLMCRVVSLLTSGLALGSQRVLIFLQRLPHLLARLRLTAVLRLEFPVRKLSTGSTGQQGYIEVARKRSGVTCSRNSW